MIFPRFRSNFIVFGTKKTKILKIHVRFCKIQNRPIFPDIVSKSEIITPSELEAILILRLRIFFCKKKICGWSGMNLLIKVYSPRGDKIQGKKTVSPCLWNSLNIGSLEANFFLFWFYFVRETWFLHFADVDFPNFDLKSNLKLKLSKFAVNLQDSGTENQWRWPENGVFRTKVERFHDWGVFCIVWAMLLHQFVIGMMKKLYNLKHSEKTLPKSVTCGRIHFNTGTRPILYEWM